MQVAMLCVLFVRHGLEPEVARGLRQGVLRDAAAVQLHHARGRHGGGRAEPPRRGGAAAALPGRAPQVHGGRAAQRQVPAAQVRGVSVVPHTKICFLSFLSFLVPSCDRFTSHFVN